MTEYFYSVHFSMIFVYKCSDTRRLYLLSIYLYFSIFIMDSDLFIYVNIMFDGLQWIFGVLFIWFIIQYNFDVFVKSLF